MIGRVASTPCDELAYIPNDLVPESISSSLLESTAAPFAVEVPTKWPA